MPSRKAIFGIIDSERNSQDQHLPTTPFELFDWLNFIDDHFLRARTSATKIEATDELRNLAACAVAAMEQYGARPRTREFGINQPTNMSKLSGMLSDLDESQFSHQGVTANNDSNDPIDEYDEKIVAAYNDEDDD